MVGLPARGKTYIARKSARYLSWLGHKTRVFNVGDYRRNTLGAGQPHQFFDAQNEEARSLLTRVAHEALLDMIDWFRHGGEVAIYDATNSMRQRRDRIRAACAEEGVRVVFIETTCDDPVIIEANIRETKLTSPDYAGLDPDLAVNDFRQRIAHYERIYEPVSKDEGAYIQIADVGRRVVVDGIGGYIPSRLVFFLMNLHVVRRPIWLTRHGESLFNPEHRIGGDPPLSPRGVAYAERLASFLTDRMPANARPAVMTSTLRRAIQTASLLPWPAVTSRALDEIDAGICDGLTYEEIRDGMPGEYAARAADKLRYRYPRGESYQDIIQRLDPVLIEIERQREPVVVIAHQAVLRALYAYFVDLPPEECPHLTMPLETIVELRPSSYGIVEERFLP